MSVNETRDRPAGGSTIQKLSFAGWCLLREGKLIGPLSTDDLVLAILRGEVDPYSRVFRIHQKSREYALLIPPASPDGTVICDITPYPIPKSDSLAPVGMR